MKHSSLSLPFPELKSDDPDPEEPYRMNPWKASGTSNINSALARSGADRTGAEVAGGGTRKERSHSPRVSVPQKRFYGQLT